LPDLIPGGREAARPSRICGTARSCCGRGAVGFPLLSSLPGSSAITGEKEFVAPDEVRAFVIEYAPSAERRQTLLGNLRRIEATKRWETPTEVLLPEGDR